MTISDLAYLQDISEETSPVGGYTVQPGDTLSGIASQLYGNTTQLCIDTIARVNNISDPNRIYPGQQIINYALWECGD